MCVNIFKLKTTKYIYVPLFLINYLASVWQVYSALCQRCQFLFPNSHVLLFWSPNFDFPITKRNTVLKVSHYLLSNFHELFKRFLGYENEISSMNLFIQVWAFTAIHSDLENLESEWIATDKVSEKSLQSSVNVSLWKRRWWVFFSM